MKLHLQSRRMFLQGAGGALLAIPTLSSLLWKSKRARAETTPPVRYIQWITNHGQFEQNFWPAAQYTPVDPAVIQAEPSPNINVRPLADIAGPLSLVLNESFDPVRSKLNLVRGLDLMVAKGYHNACAPTCASWPREDDHVPFFPYSVDAILETSNKVYPTATRIPALRLTPGVSSAYKWGSFSWTLQNGAPFKLPAYDNMEAALNAVFPGTAAGPNTDASLTTRIQLTDHVLDDFKRVSRSTALGSADKKLLSQYMDLLGDLQRRMRVQASACAAPKLHAETDFDALHQNAIELSVAALLCGATRVIAYHCYQGSATQYDEGTFHAWAHNDVTSHGRMMVYRYQQLAKLLRAMDQAIDSDGQPLLDHALVYAGNELSDPGHGARHLQNMPIVLAGGANGRLSTGNYIDFSGRLMNSLLLTIFAVMGLAPEDYERNGVIGFGDYQGENSSKYKACLANVERRKPLPFPVRQLAHLE